MHIWLRPLFPKIEDYTTQIRPIRTRCGESFRFCEKIDNFWYYARCLSDHRHFMPLFLRTFVCFDVTFFADEPSCFPAITIWHGVRWRPQKCWLPPTQKKNDNRCGRSSRVYIKRGSTLTCGTDHLEFSRRIFNTFFFGVCYYDHHACSAANRPIILPQICKCRQLRDAPDSYNNKLRRVLCSSYMIWYFFIARTSSLRGTAIYFLF